MKWFGQHPEVVWEKRKSNKRRVGKKAITWGQTLFTLLQCLNIYLWTNVSYNPAVTLPCWSSVPYSLLAIEIGFWDNHGIFKNLLVKAGACPVCYCSPYSLKIHNKPFPPFQAAHPCNCYLRSLEIQNSHSFLSKHYLHIPL